MLLNTLYEHYIQLPFHIAFTVEAIVSEWEYVVAKFLATAQVV